MEYVEKNNLLSSVQHGFRAGRSTITSLLATDKYIADWVNGSIPFDIVSFDMSKAFDRVPYDLVSPSFYVILVSVKTPLNGFRTFYLVVPNLYN